MSGEHIFNTRSGRSIKVTEKMKTHLETAKSSEVNRRRAQLAIQLDKLAQSEEEAEQMFAGFKKLTAEKQELMTLQMDETKDLTLEETRVYEQAFAEDLTVIEERESIIRSKLNGDSEQLTSTKLQIEPTKEERPQHQTAADVDQAQTALAEIEAKRLAVIRQNELDDERLKLEAMNRDLKRKEEMLRLEKELQMARAKMGMFPKSSQPGESEHNLSFLNSTPNEARGSSLEEKLAGAFSKLADVMSTSMSAPRSQQNIMKIEPDTFSGKILDFAPWLSAFEELVEEIRPERRMIYLLKYTSEDAKNAIVHFRRLDPLEAYSKAMAKLKERYQNNFRVYEAYREKMDEWPQIRDGDGPALRRYADFLSSCLAAKQEICYLSVFDDYAENIKMTRKLSKRMVDRWSCKVDDWAEHNKDSGSEFPPFRVYVEFVEKQARIECGPIKSSLSRQQGEFRHPRQARVNLTEAEDEESVEDTVSHQQPSAVVNTAKSFEKKSPKLGQCLFCKGSHSTPTCSKLMKLSPRERHQWARKANVCKSCVKEGHYMSGCREPERCKTCGKQHNTVFHDDNYLEYIKPKERREVTSAARSQPKEPSVEQANVNSAMSGQDEAALILPVRLRQGSSDKSMIVYAILDSQSDTCFVSTEVQQALQLEGRRTHLELRTMAGDKIVPVSKCAGLTVSDLEGNQCIALPKTYAQDVMNATHSQIPRPEDVEKWPHLRKIADHIHPVMKDVPIGLLIGRNCVKAVKPRDCIPGNDEDPYAVRTLLGWGAVGRVDQSKPARKRPALVNFTATREVSMKSVLRMFELDYNEALKEEATSVEDRKFIQQLEEGMTITEDGHLELPLPKKDDSPMANNRQQALAVAMKLKRELQRDPDYHQAYTEFMEGMLNDNHSEEAPESYIDGWVWYVTHHGVIHPHKKKLRCVFNCSICYKGFCLNKKLLPGPDQINNLTGVFCRFRKPKKVIKCDIVRMFYQVLVKTGDRDLLRFFWWPEGKLDQPPKEYRMRVHLFGATSSPGCANFALKKTVEMHGDGFAPETSEFIRNNFYVDDGLGGDDDVDSAARLANESHELCKLGGFNLSKYESNDPEVLARIPEERRAPESASSETELGTEVVPEGRTLGIWNSMARDKLYFKAQAKENPKTRRGVLSTVSAIYDPLGLVAPFVMTGKRLLQEICQENKEWDDPLSPEMERKYDEWLDMLPELDGLEVDRCFVDQDFVKPYRVQLHTYADASFGGYGAASYIKIIDAAKKVKVSLAMGKSRVPPVKPQTMPRMELVAAVVAVRMAKFLKDELGYDEIEIYFYSDSMIVLGYIYNECKRFHIFVANRVVTIRELSAPEQWYHVDGLDNPADLASRGMTVKEIKENRMWLYGPACLQDPDYEPKKVEKFTVAEDDKEVKKATVNVVMTKALPEPRTLLDMVDRVHKWSKVVNVVARMLGWLWKVRPGFAEDKVHLKSKAMVAIVRASQSQHFKKEAEIQNQEPRDRVRFRKANVAGDHRLRTLDVFTSEDGVIRVGGRAKNSDFPYEEKFPAVMDKKCRVSKLMIEHHHRKTGHSGREAILNALRREGIWILHPRDEIGRCKRSCVVCLRLAGSVSPPKMGELPEDRLRPEAPFTYVGADFFGPYTVKLTRNTTAKRYGVMYTCLVSRSVHIDLAKDLSAQGFVRSFRRFTNRRGPCRVLRCDRGTNFLAARKELEKSLEDWPEDEIRTRLLEMNCEFVSFVFNPPHSSHMGGVWERQIRTARSIMNAIMAEASCSLDEDGIRTLFSEAEGIMNSRPLTEVDTHDGHASSPLSPQMLLTMKPKVPPPPKSSSDEPDKYALKRWDEVQRMAEVFWNRWRTELVPRLQSRRKWQEDRPNLAPGDVVLMVEPNAPRLDWPRARVVEVKTSKDGRVRSATVRSSKNTYVRPVHKLILLVKNPKL